MRRHGRPVLDFVLGKHRQAMPDEVLELLRNADPNQLVTPCRRAQVETYAEAASTMLRSVYGTDIAPGSILPVPGGRPALSLLASTLIRPHDSVIVFDPAYPAFTRITERLGAKIHGVPLDPDRDLAPNLDVLPPDTVESVRFAALNYPNNPTGAIIDSEHLDAFLKLLHPEAIVFNDATYGPLTFDEPPWSMLAQPEAVRHDHRLLELHSLAKLFSVGAIAVSFFAGDEALIGELRNSSEFVWSNQSRLHLEVAIYCLGDHDHLAATREIFRDRVRRLEQTLTALGFEVLHPKSGMYIVCRVPSAIGGRQVSGAGAAAKVLLEEHDLAVVPWEVEPHEYLRFSAQYSEKDLEGLAALGRDGSLLS
ncbi:MAG: pyridoxal phosphate-dependent aminotransferase [Thermoanaerobaculales bacterium]